MAVERIRANQVGGAAIELAYEAFGDPKDPALLLVMGLGTQMIAWPEPFCRELAGRGFYVVRFDNRDVGESTHLDGIAAPSAVAVAFRRRPPAYTLDDFAADTVGLIEALDLGPVHLVGASMGGFISQLVTISRPDVVRSLTLMMTTTGARRVGQPSPRVLSAILRRKPLETRDDVVAAGLSLYRLIGSPRYPHDDGYLRTMVGAAFDRGHDPSGQRRQLGAVAAQRNRSRSLGAIGVPTVVLHGFDDHLVHYTGGIALARAIPGARFVGFPGMGHDLPAPLWPQFADEIAAVAGAAEDARPA
jgi:pimeloyl-ACP methyl ester carboxylesterase